MSLRFRLNLLITVLFLLLFTGGGVHVINNARHVVAEEVRSSAMLALQLVEMVLAVPGADGDAELQRELVARFAEVDSARHLHLAVRRLDDAGGAPDPEGTLLTASAPAWFVRLVEPPPIEYRRILAGAGLPDTEIVIRADPSDEITEAWSEARSVLVLLLVFISLANVLVYVSLGRDLAPIESILQGLERIERGDYRLHLPSFRSSELTRISEKFNHMADVLLQSRNENRLLRQRSLEIQEQERRRLARELHDEMGQSISAIRAVAASISGSSDTDAGSVRRGADTILQIAERSYDAARSMMHRLRPAVLDELGLVTALQELVDAWNGSHGDVFCRLECPQDLGPLGDEVEIGVYRIVQEALTNVARHAKAGDVLVRVERTASADGDRLEVLIRDDGIGLVPAQGSGGFGLAGMRERAESLAGEFRLRSARGTGVEISVMIPLP
jgi:two-component system sensor histidine kinase UhpB